MADVMNSLFGMTPESIQRQRDNELEARAMKYAELDPFQRATMSIYQGAGQLGSAVGGLLGGRDPELQRITQRQALLQQTQPADAAGWSSLGSRLMQAGDIQGAQEAYAKAQTLTNSSIKNALDTSTMASNLATAAGRQFDISPEGRGQELAKTGKFTSESIKNFIAGKGQLEAVDKLTKPQADFIAKAVELGYGDKPNYGGYSQEQTAKVNAALFNEDIQKGKARSSVINNEIKQAPNIIDAVNAVDKATEKEVSMLDSARLAKTLINETAKSNNSQAWEASRTTIAKAVGESKLSNEDIRRTGVDPRLVQGALDWVNKKIDGVPNADIQKQLFVLGSVLENDAAARYDAKVKRFRGAAEASKFPGNPSTYFPTAAERTGGANAPKAVDWSSLK
jgi:hypothetical protein